MVLFYLFICLVILSPLPLGGNSPVAWTFFAFLAGVLVVWFCLRGIILKQAVAVPFGWIWFPAVMFIGVCFWALLQSLPVMPVGLQHPLWQVASEALGQDVSGAISINPYATGTALLRLMSYGGVFWLALQFGRERKQADIILKSIAFAIAVYALYGLVLWSIGSETILWYEKWTPGKRLSATFVNPNNFATFAGMGGVVFLALLARSLRRGFRGRDGEQVKHRINRLAHIISGVGGIYILAFMIVMGALFLSGSRGGFAATLFAMGMLIVFYMLRSRAGLAGLGAVFAIAAVIFVFLFDLGGEKLATRLQQTEISGEQRPAAYRITIRAIMDSPLLGTGYGTFRDVFPIYRDETISTWGVRHMAHNTYLENMLELGLPAALALFMAIGSCIWLCLRGAVMRRRGSHLPLIGVGVSVLVALHSLVDFSLQIPGVVIIYAALLGLGVAQSWSSKKR